MAKLDMTGMFQTRVNEVNKQLDLVYSGMEECMKTKSNDEKKYQEALSRYDNLLKNYKNLLQCLSMLTKSYYDMKNISSDTEKSKQKKSTLQVLREQQKAKAQHVGR